MRETTQLGAQWEPELQEWNEEEEEAWNTMGASLESKEWTLSQISHSI